MAFCKAQDIHITAYSPLGCKDRVWRSDNDDVPLLEHPILLQVAKKYEKTVPQLLLKWQVGYINFNQCCQLFEKVLKLVGAVNYVETQRVGNTVYT